MEVTIQEVSKVKIPFRIVPDYPKQGINFVDISSVTVDEDAFHTVVRDLISVLYDKFFTTDYTFVGIDARGFLLAGALAYSQHRGVALARKKGKLPAETYSQEYSLEYGTATIEMNKVDIQPGHNYIIVDDIVATGGTIGAVEKLITSHGGTVLCSLALVQIKACQESLMKAIHHPVYVLRSF